MIYMMLNFLNKKLQQSIKQSVKFNFHASKVIYDLVLLKV